MGKEGRLSKDKFGFDQPVDAPLYHKPPFYYRNNEAICVDYETDEEAALDMLPQGLELTSPAMAALVFVRYPFSTFGPYNEAMLWLYCTWKGEDRVYIPHIVTDTEMPLAAGRELWGFPKKLAHVEMERGADLIWGSMERPKGYRICSAGVRLERPGEIEQAEMDVACVSLRVIPNAEEGKEPSVAELIDTTATFTTLELWEGPGWAQYDAISPIDPWYKLEVKKVVGASYRIYHQLLPCGKVVKTY